MSIWLRGLLLGITLSANICLALEHSVSIGVSGGKAYYIDPFTTDVMNLSNPLATRRTVLTNLSDSGTIWGFLAGYQVACCLGWFAGIEFNIDWYDLDKTQDIRFSDAREVRSWQGLLQFEREPVVAAVARVGYKIAPYFLPYVRAGVETSHDRLQSTFTSVRTNLSPLMIEDEERSYRFTAGIGAEFPLAIPTHPSVRLEYNYHAKGKTVEAVGTLNDSAGISPTFSSSTKPKMHTGTASLVWNFGNRRIIKKV